MWFDELWIIQRSELARTCHKNCRKGAREANTNTNQFEWNAVWIYARKMNNTCDDHCEENAGGILKKGQEVAYVFGSHGNGFWWSAKKSDGVGHKKEGFIRSNGSGSYELAWWCTNKREGSAYSEEFGLKVGVHQGSVLSPLLFAIVVDVFTEKARKSVVNKLWYEDDLVIMSETMEGLKERFWNWKDALESKSLKINTRKI